MSICYSSLLIILDDVLKEIIKQRQKRRAAVADQKSLADLIDQENRQYSSPSPVLAGGRRHGGGLLPLPDLSQLQLISSVNFPVADDNEETIDEDHHEEQRQNGFPIERFHNIETPSNSALQELSDLEEMDIENEVSNVTQERLDESFPTFGFDEYTQTSPQTNVSR